MTWNIRATGHKEQCLAAIEASTPPGDPAGAEQYADAVDMLKHELKNFDSGATEMSVAATGHAPGDEGGDRIFSIWISGKALPRPEAKPAAEAPKAPPVVETTKPPAKGK